MSVLTFLLAAPASTISILIIAVTISLISMIVYRLLTDVKKLQSINDEISKYNEKMRDAQKKGSRAELRRLRREETRVKILASFSTKQRMKVTLVTIIPFSLVSILLGSFYGARSVARLPFDTPYGSDLSFYIWYTFCYMSAYLPLTRLFGLSLSTAIPLRRDRSGRGG